MQSCELKTYIQKVKKTDPSNYRQISILPLISKIIEKSLSFLADKILKGLDEGLLSGMMLINLLKAFDTIDHKILL